MFLCFLVYSLLILSLWLVLWLVLLPSVYSLDSLFFGFLEVRSVFQKSFLLPRILLEGFRFRILCIFSSLLGTVRSSFQWFSVLLCHHASSVPCVVLTACLRLCSGRLRNLQSISGSSLWLLGRGLLTRLSNILWRWLLTLFCLRTVRIGQKPPYLKQLYAGKSETSLLSR